MSAEWLNEHRREAFIDFHTGAVASDLLAHFDADAYVGTLERAGANLITTFAKCHHGYAYYPTDIGVRHPYLKQDMLGQVLAEAGRRSIPVIAYQNVSRDALAARQNPDWQMLKRDGSPIEASYHGHVCINSPYIPERLWPMTHEVIDRYPSVRGFFFDFVLFPPETCFCPHCRRRMQTEGVDPANELAVRFFQRRCIQEFIDITAQQILARIPDAAISFNISAYVGCLDGLKGQNYICIESMPSTWGYERTPLLGRYLRNQPIHFSSMTGRFHKSWADFGGIKSDASYRYEAGLALALGASFTIGDQANPDGTLDPAAYEGVGKAFSYYARREAWIDGARSLPYVALLSQSYLNPMDAWATAQGNYGLLNALLEEHVHFDVIDARADFTPYAAIVAEDVMLPDPALALKLAAYVEQGGGLLTLGGSIFKGPARTAVEQLLGVRLAGLSPYSQNYIRTPEGDLGARLPKTDWMAYGPAVHLAPAGAEGVVSLVYPFTEPSDQRAVSHAQAHPARVSPYPAVLLRRHGQGLTATVASPLGTLYQEHAYPPLRILLKNLLDRLIPAEKRIVELTAPLSAELVLTQQGQRTIIHLLNFHTNRAGKAVRVIEEIPPVLDAEIRLLRAQDPKRVYLAPEDADLAWTRRAGQIVIHVPRYDTHAMVVVE